MGPFAEDFFRAFRLGTDEKAVGHLDLAGVSLAAIKALDARTQEVTQLRSEVDALRAELAELRKLVQETRAAAPR
jgi:selenocysteine lyase/cysteine desulfurase